MEGTFKADKSITMFAFELESYHDFDMLFWKHCGCGCDQLQLFGFDGDVSVRIDVITNDQARYMYE